MIIKYFPERLYNRQFIDMRFNSTKQSLLIFNLLIISLFLISSATTQISQEQRNGMSTESRIEPASQQKLTEDIKICDGNRFQFLSSFVLGRQNDLTKTFAQIEKTLKLNNITYSDRPGRQYKIFNFKPHLLYLESKQVAQIKSMNVLNISGGSIRMTYTFDWEKQQLGVPMYGNGSGVVSSDMISFEKTLQTNETHELQWIFKRANPITITNSLTLQKFIPYKQIDYEIVNQMLNELKGNLTTVKSQLVRSLNANFTSTLKGIVKEDQTIAIPKQIQYNYNDYRGPFTVIFDNVLLQNSLTKNGLSLILSQVIKDDKNFECGKKVPQEPENVSKYGGTQQYISNTFFKSTLKYALQGHSLDVTLSQDNWQSRAFQFFVGDLHEVISSTKNVSSYKELNGKCQAINDKSFNIEYKSISSFAVKVNFTCYLEQSGTKLVDIVLPVEYQVSPTLTTKQLNFVIKSIKGTPKFVENQKFKISNSELASFMLMQTLNMAVKSKVIGSGYKTKSRKNPQLQVRSEYVFLYDKSTISQEEKSE